ncbi:MAG: hypothetical protein WBO28_14860 [Flavobacteriales bacterium]|jgi:hypothetical protein
MKNPNQRHSDLIKALAPLYIKENGTPEYKYRPEGLNSGTIETLGTNEINGAVRLLVDLFELSGGSIANIDLYRLLQVYMTMPQCRDGINELVEKAHSEMHAFRTA